MATEVNARRLARSWQFDFKLPGRKRERKGGFRTKAEALAAGRELLRRMAEGVREVTLSEAFDAYMASTRMKDRSADSHRHHWKRIGPELGYLLIEEVTTERLDEFKRTLPRSWSPQTTNHHLGLIRTVLRHMWKRGRIAAVPYVPMESIPRRHQDWYTEEERDRLLEGMFRWHPRWYLFFYLTCRLGLRRGEVYAITHRQLREKPPTLIVDQQVQTANGARESKLISRKNNEALVLALTPDVIDAVRWHVEQGYAGKEFLFFEDGRFPRFLDGHVRSLRDVQTRLGMRHLGHHAVGRHSVASQAATGGESIKAIQAQLGHRSEQSTHKYAHLGSRAQLHVVEALEPAVPPHATGRETEARVNLVSTSDGPAIREVS